MNDETRRWIEAGKTIAVDANAKVLCPHCLSEFLEVRDFHNTSAPEEIERAMRCPVCGTRNALRLRRPVSE